MGKKLVRKEKWSEAKKETAAIFRVEGPCRRRYPDQNGTYVSCGSKEHLTEDCPNIPSAELTRIQARERMRTKEFEAEEKEE